MKRTTKMFESLQNKRSLFSPGSDTSSSQAKTKQTGTRTRKELGAHIDDLEKINIELHAARRAAFNLLEDAVQSREALRRSEENYRTILEQEVLDRTADLKNSRQQYVSLVENTPDLITRWNKYLKLVYANTAFAEKFGSRLKDLYGKTYLEMGQPDKIAIPFMAGVAEVFETDHAAEHYNSFSTPDGEVFYHSRIVPERNEKGEIETVLSITRDITSLKKADQEIIRLKDEIARQATDKYLQLFNSIDEGFCIVEVIFDEKQEGIDYCFLETNPAFVNQSSLQNAVGKCMKELVPQHEQFWFHTYGEIAKTGEPKRFEHYASQIGGGIWYEVYAFRIDEPEKHHVAILFNDISARKNAEEELRINEERIRGLKEAYQAVVNGVALKDSLNILTQIVVKETAGEARTAFYLADPEGAHLNTVRGAGNMPLEYADEIDGFVIGPDSLAWGLAVPMGQPVLTSDVYEEPLWKPWLYVAEKYDYRGCWSFPIKTRENKVIGTFAMYFQEPREAKQKDIELADLITQAASVIITQHTETQQRLLAEETLRESEENLKRLNASLEHQVKDRTKELNILNSELKNFNNITANNYAETLRHVYINLETIVTTDARNLSNSSRANIRRAQAAIQKMKLLTNDINHYLELYDLGIKKELIDPNIILIDVKERMQKKIEDANATINVNQLPNLPADPKLFSKLMTNIIDNAIKFKKPDADPVININYSVVAEPNSNPAATENVAYTVITITDNGIGFRNDETDKIFDLFTQLEDGKHKGSGIGLAICKKIMDMHRGLITAESEPGKGSAFSCYFPPAIGKRYMKDTNRKLS